jgi:N-methylhydantoinase A
MQLDVALAERAILAHVAEPLGLSLHDAARGILAIADSNMVGAIRVVSVERGHDPGDFTLVAFGGAGPLHGCTLAELLGIRSVLVPPAPGVLCAEGLLSASLKAEFSRTLPRPDDWEAAQGTFAVLEAEAHRWFDGEHVPVNDRRITCVALLRYQGQGAELSIVWPGSAETARAAFTDAHLALNGFVLDSAIELVTLRLEAQAVAGPSARSTLASGRGAVVPLGRQLVHHATGALEASVFDRAQLGTGDQIAGPAIVTQLDSTTLIAPAWCAEVLATGSLLLRNQP